MTIVTYHSCESWHRFSSERQVHHHAGHQSSQSHNNHVQADVRDEHDVFRGRGNLSHQDQEKHERSHKACS